MKNLADLELLRNQYKNEIENENRDKVIVLIGMGTCGIAAGAKKVLAALQKEVQDHALYNVIIRETGCIGMCEQDLLILPVPARHA